MCFQDCNTILTRPRVAVPSFYTRWVMFSENKEKENWEQSKVVSECNKTSSLPTAGKTTDSVTVFHLFMRHQMG